jgi:outer membrane receptor protein involved in Fe transport
MRRFSYFLVFLTVWVLLSATFALAAAASGSGSVEGTVKDALGRPLVSVTLELKSGDGRVIGHTTSDAKGHFIFHGVAPGNYEVSARKDKFKSATSIALVAAGSTGAVAITMEAVELTLPVITERLDKARERLDPKIGTSDYHFSQQAIKDLPAGNNNSLNQVLLQAPGVAQDSFGQVHIRGEHANIQYRIDGIQLPENIAFFLQGQSPRFARSIDLLTGALPAQYGFQTAAVVDIKTRTGAFETGGDIEFYGGQRNTAQPSFEIGGTKGRLSYFATGQFLNNNRGVEPPTPGPSAFHDNTQQGNFFGYGSYIINPQTRVSLISGTSLGQFNIPAQCCVPPAFTLAGVNDVNPDAYSSKMINESQVEQNYYNIISLQGSVGSKLTWQLAPFSRYETIKFNPDKVGDLIYTGVATNVFRSSFVNGLQGDASYELPYNNTARVGFYFSGESGQLDNHALTFPADSMGNQTGTTPVFIKANQHFTTWLYDGYIQDEWRPNEKWTVNGGLRFDLFDDVRRSNQLLPRFGTVYKPWETSTFHAGYAYYFTPIPTELANDHELLSFQGTTGAAPSLLNSKPEPERAQYFDVGAIQQISSSLSAGVDSYFKYSRDLIDEGQFGSALIFTPFNYKRGKQYGVETTLQYSEGPFTAYLNQAFGVAHGTRLGSGQFTHGLEEQTFIQGRYVSLDHEQTITGSAGMVYRWKKWTATLDGINQSGLRGGFANTGNLPTYFQFNFGLTKLMTVFKDNDFEARFDIINMFDHLILIRNGTGIGVSAVQYGPRLTFYGGLKWNFNFAKPSAVIGN